MVCKDFASVFRAICADSRMQVASEGGRNGEADEDHHRKRFAVDPAGPEFQPGLVSAVRYRRGNDRLIGVIFNLDRPALEEWLNSGELHRSQGADGSAQVCLNSLLARVQNTKTS